jgi:valyl-tRNA synthetase
VLAYVLDTCFRLLHPYMPFVTEAAWQYLPHEGDTLMLASWPQADRSLIDPLVEERMSALMEMVRGVRNVRTEYNVEPGRRIQGVIAPGSYAQEIQQYAYIFTRLCHMERIELLENGSGEPENSASVIVNDAAIYLPLAGMVDIAAECQRLTKEQDKLRQQIQRSQNLLGNENFISRANPEVVDRERKTLADLQASVSQVRERLSRLCS